MGMKGNVMTTTWRSELIDALKDHGESWSDIESITLADAELDMPFDNSYGVTEGAPFTAWTHKRVYFPIRYDGAEWVGSVSRHPDGHATEHQGG